MTWETSNDAFRNASKSKIPFHELSGLTHDKFISSLPDPLSSMAQEISQTSDSDKSDHFEILVRSHVLKTTEILLDAFKANDEAILEEAMVELISFIRSVIDFCLYLAKRSTLKEKDKWSDMDSAQMRKVPFLLLEDSFDSLPMSLTRLLWTYGPAEWLPNICDDTLLFNQGSKYVLIRIANKLLKSLSVNAENQAASFAGEISMTLAAVFPLSERSAVNVLGSFHTDNIVKFESMEEWMGNKGSEKEHQQLALNYDFYSKFWGVQHVFTNPKELLPLGSKVWNENMDNFLEEMKFILSLFEGRSFKPDLIKHLNTRWKKAKNGSRSRQKITIDTDGDTEMKNTTEAHASGETLAPSRQYKYLTNSQLLHLQLQDPEIRMQFLTQLLIISKYLTSSLAAFVLTPAGSNVTTKMICEKNQGTLHQVEVRAAELMKAIPPNGEEHFKTLDWILKDRESIWRQWKKNKCEPPIEQFATNDADAGNTKKEKKDSYELKSTNSESIAMKAELYSFKIDIEKTLPIIAKDLASNGNHIDQFLDEYADALDPDAGIEEEYHPRKNKLSSWRALRFLSRDYIGHFGDNNKKCMISKRTGDFEGIVRKIWKEDKGIDIPGDMPDVEENISESESDEDEEDEKEMSHSEELAEELSDSKGKVEEVSKDMLDEENHKDEKDPQETEEGAQESSLKDAEIDSNEHEVASDAPKEEKEKEAMDTTVKASDKTALDESELHTIMNGDESRADEELLKSTENKEAETDSRSRQKRSRSNSVDRSNKKQKGETAKNELTEDIKSDNNKDDSTSHAKTAPNDDNRTRDNSRASNRPGQPPSHPQPHRGGSSRGPQYPPSGMRRSPPPNSGHGQPPQRGPTGPGNFRGPGPLYGGPRGRGDDRGPRGGGRGGMERDRRGGAGQRNSRR